MLVFSDISFRNSTCTSCLPLRGCGSTRSPTFIAPVTPQSGVVRPGLPRPRRDTQDGALNNLINIHLNLLVYSLLQELYFFSYN